MCCESAAADRRSHHITAAAWPSPLAPSSPPSPQCCCSRCCRRRSRPSCLRSSSSSSSSVVCCSCQPPSPASRDAALHAAPTTIAVAAVARLLALAFMLLLCSSPGLAVEPAVRDVLDLVQGLQATSPDQLSGVQYTRGFNNNSDALWLRDTSRHLVLSKAESEKVLERLSEHQEITFLCTLKQEAGTSGTLLALATETHRFLEIESSGRRDELRFHFSHRNQARTETFPYRLADGQWHRLALSLSADSVSLFVDCERIYRRVIPTPDRVWSGSSRGSRSGASPDPLRLFLGQRNSQHALFRGALQDVKIVTQAHGYLLQCPNSDTDCPTCAQFQALQQKLDEMKNMYINLNKKLSRAEGRIADLEQCECLRGCEDANGILRKDGETWKDEKEPCLNYLCKDGAVNRTRETCDNEALKDCPSERVKTLDGKCCPICSSNERCIYQGKHYSPGEEVNPRVCVTCTCADGSMVCYSKNVTAECPELDCPEEEQISIVNQCCPVCKGTDYCSMGRHKCHANASCVNRDTMFACQCNAGFEGDGYTCSDIDECQTVGGPRGHHCSVNARCVNVMGSYRCDCQKGHGRLSNYECTGISSPDSAAKSSATPALWRPGRALYPLDPFCSPLCPPQALTCLLAVAVAVVQVLSHLLREARGL